MKKGLLSILAGALLVVGCQNYDDQFDQLENQISALSQTVAGLAQVQSDLSTLAGTVGSLQSALSSQIDTALADGLADIDAAVAELEAATADAASADAVQEIADAVAENQTDLEELLAQSSVFQGNIKVSTPAMLDAYHAMGDGLAIVNGYVDIDVTSSMDIAKVQELVNFILVTTGDFAYTAATGVDTEVTFSNLTGTQSLTLDQEGGYMLENLESATIITLDDDSSVDVVHLGSLTSVTSLSDGTGAGTFTFAKGTELHLTSLPRSPSTALSLGVDEGGVIALTALTDTDASGDDTKLNLTVSGPATFTLPAGVSGDKSGSTLIASEIGTLTTNGYDGTVTIGQDVLNFVSDNVVALTITGNDLVSVDMTGALDPNATTADTEGPDVTLKGQGDLETVSIAGETDEIVIGTTTSGEGNGNLVSLTIAGNVVGAGGISIANNSDLTTVDISAANTDKVVIDGNSDLEALTVDFTAAKGAATTQEGTITVNNNESLESLTISTSAIDNLSITNNADLATIDLSGMTAIGATGTASVSISGNDLSASKSDNGDDGTTNAADGAAGDLGSFTTTSGMATAKAYLTAVAADADSKANVVFDTVDSAVSNEGASETDLGSDILTGALTQVLVLTPKDVTTPAQDATKHKLAFGISIAGGSTMFGLSEPDGANLLVDGSENAVSSLTLDANPVLAIAKIKRAAALTRATAYDLTLDAFQGFKPTGEIRISNTTTTAEYSLNASKNGGAVTLKSGDYLNLTIDGLTVSTTQSSNSALTATEQAIDRLTDKWTTQYGTANSASYSYSLFTVSSASGKITIAAKAGSGRRGYDKAYSIKAVPATTVGASSTLNAEYGATSSSADNKTISNGIIVTLESNIAGVLLDAVAGASFVSNAAASVTQLTTTNKPVANVNTTTTKNIFPKDARGDSVLPESSVTEVATAATSYNRVGWL
ncbi:hypothetical protein OAQ42_01730 [Flavobacteriaceae bacterium]|nr:hypothetical protein [Flavobacteriaceae bacterium]